MSKVRKTANRPKGLRGEWIRMWDGSWILVGRIRAASRKFFIYRPEGHKSVCLTHRNSGYKAFEGDEKIVRIVMAIFERLPLPWERITARRFIKYWSKLPSEIQKWREVLQAVSPKRLKP